MASSTRNASIVDGGAQWYDQTYAEEAGGGYAYHPDVTDVAPTTALLLSGFGFAADIPPGATIDGIEVSISRRGTVGESIWIYDSTVQLYSGGSPSGSNKADTSTHWPDRTGAFGTATYGGAADTWGATRTRDAVCNSSFGVALACRSQGSSGIQADVDHIAITVYYTGGAWPTGRAFCPGIIG